MEDDNSILPPTETHALEQGQADRGETAAVGQARLVHSDEASNRKGEPANWQCSISPLIASCEAAMSSR
jgi:hypothetical protein